MKRVALLGLAALLAMGVVAWGQLIPPSDSETLSSTFIIPGRYDLYTIAGDLNFPAGSDVGDPAAGGSFFTNVWWLQLDTNIPLNVRGVATAFVGPVTLPTAVQGTAWRLVGGVWTHILSTAWLPAPGNTGLQPVPGIGQFRASVQLGVTRNGFFDPAGTYTATVTITASPL